MLSGGDPASGPQPSSLLSVFTSPLLCSVTGSGQGRPIENNQSEAREWLEAGATGGGGTTEEVVAFFHALLISDRP